MSYSNHIRNMLNPAEETNPISIRLTTRIINQLDELSQTLDKNRSELIETFIKAGIEETEKFLQEKSKDFLLELENDNAASNEQRYFLLNTNFNNVEDDHYAMLENQEASAFVDGRKQSIERLQAGDIVFLYQSGHGIVAYGYADKELIKRPYNGKADESYSKKLNQFKRLESVFTPKKCKDAIKGNLNYRLTLSQLPTKKGQQLFEEIKKQNTL